MRELKFRVWSDFWKRYAFDAELYADGSLYAMFDDDNGVPHHENTDLVVEFNTNLKDKNDKEIYEGDIVKCVWADEFYRGIYEVKFDEERAGFVPFAKGDGCGCCEEDTIGGGDYVEIVGNIHRNPELLEDK